MHILCTGAAGVIGRKLTARLRKDGALGSHAISRLTLTDIVAPQEPADGGADIIIAAADLAKPGAAAQAIVGRAPADRRPGGAGAGGTLLR
jgi:hypothetical protein